MRETDPYIVLLMLAINMLIGFVLIKRRGLTFGATLAATAALACASAAILLAHSHGRTSWLFDVPRGSDVPRNLVIAVRAFFAAGLPLVGVPFLVMVIQKWAGIGATEEERRPGAAGVAAWLSTWNLVWAAYVAMGLWFVTGLFVITGFVILTLLLAAYPLVQAVAQAPSTNPEPPDPREANTATLERERVLQMVAEKIITAEEGARLLLALQQLGHSQAGVAFRISPSIQRDPFARNFVVGGFALFILGFCLPWIQFNPFLPAKEGSGGSALQTALSRFPDVSAPEGMQSHLDLMAKANFSISGFSHPYGWALLLLNLFAFGYAIFGRSPQNTTAIVFYAAACGVLVLLLLYNMMAIVHLGQPGFWLALAGTGLLALGLTRLRPAAPLN